MYLPTGPLHQPPMTNPTNTTDPFAAARPIRCPPITTSGKVLTKQIKAFDRTTLVLSYTTDDANALRALVQSMHLKAGKKPTLSVLARRALRFYLDRLPGMWATEIEALNKMTTREPKPAPRSKKSP